MTINILSYHFLTISLSLDDVVSVFSDGKETSFCDNVSNICSIEPIAHLHQSFKVKLALLFDLGSVNLEDLKSSVLVRKRDLDLSVQSSSSQQSRVQGIWSVGSHDDLSLAQVVESVHLIEQFHQRSLDLSICRNSPIYLSTIADAGEKMKLAPIVAATAFANSVFPVPGGPYSSTPFGGLIPTLMNSSGFFRGNSITSLSSRTCSVKPPIPPNEISPGSNVVILYTKGSTSRGRIRITVNVVMSNATRTPFFNFSRFMVERHPTMYRGPEEAFTMNLSSSNCFSTSPMICPMDCNALMSSSVFVNFFSRSLIPKRASFKRDSH
ncbi:hypothetical protein OGAPHI_001270 [Ogataea philodendri]|uniref:Uncharacterized protein n=1 Tax=Ogataea philodendri TaxID=1378263 RepID=A0A9P8PGB7_9ASCO|nr:uncharacterized protein OGAPHI_001270 [Ogataea philodendri]KAH3670754.1 hypothetical protein OGAPHI_001270 [Ogataea philodendri]